MNEKQIDAILDSAKAELKMILKTQHEVDVAFMYMTDIIHLLHQPFITREIPGVGGVVVVINNMPLYSKEFCDILRVVANVLELSGEIRRKEES